MYEWLPAYKALATLELDNPEIRKDKKTITYLNRLGLNISSLEEYWERVEFIANNAYGNVLEIGCSTGNITKYISKNENVKSVLAIDILPEFIDFLKRLNLNKVNACVLNLITEKLPIDYKIDCVIITELIEHITTNDEIQILENIHANLTNKTRFIITTPIGYMVDPDHIRGFSRIACKIHILFLYGNIQKIADNGIQQFYVAQNHNRPFFWKLEKLLEVFEKLIAIFLFLSARFLRVLNKLSKRIKKKLKVSDFMTN